MNNQENISSLPKISKVTISVNAVTETEKKMQ